MRRDHWQRRIAELDPDTDYERISRLVSQYEFSWDIMQALSFALFRTYAVPSIGKLLYETGEFTTDTQRRHDDTVLILEHISVHGMETDPGRSAIRRMNQMHGRYNITNDEMLYVLATFVVTPVRWVQQYGKRALTEAEIRAGVHTYRRLGALMGIHDIPRTFADFAAFMDDYETQHFRPNPYSTAVADATLELFATFYPRILRPAVRRFSRAILDDHLRSALGYRGIPKWQRSAAAWALRLRGQFAGLLPARRRPFRIAELRHRVRSYPGGYLIEHLGTFEPELAMTADRKNIGHRSVDSTHAPVRS